MTALTPGLTALDERILAAVPEDGRAVRAGHVAGLVFGRRLWRCDRCGHETLCNYLAARPKVHARGEAIGCIECHIASGCTHRAKTMRPVLIASPEDTQTTREVLHGLQRIGLLRCGRGGWWRRP